MADELRLIFIIVGALVLGALLLHGLWTVRKNSGQPKHRYFDESANSSSEKADGFDDLGVGPVRVVKKSTASSTDKPAAVATETVPAAPVAKTPKTVTEVQTELAFDEPTEPQLNFNALDDEEPQQTGLDEPLNSAEDTTTAAEPAEVLILYVLLPEHKDMKGPDLLSALLTLGFKYGDMDIFHRHQDSAGSGAVLFSLANMFNPGTFDLENIDKLSTRGVSLFMTLPGPGEPLGNFNLMHNAAKKLAEEFGGQVLDGQRSVLTVQTVRHYVDKIREFQRQQLIHG
ncbi:MAG: cell division protein ZipA [Gammaproteobacteria bacterium]|nr:cell division protein ZipA [Gammaproteobacteria bacterium]MBU1556198.1 cell division protein ZipA [Gammaproteobacteria bacterium]MBU2070647.1 cell division protein ZipA [Gammaproteobacteria bacterium]MBU2182129.1 cell division protein ZipA [Gammaproteobacteria bacterium]MBU2207016.1 cell division protein ZipA [Gammaproteobacteria bacterium]